MQARDQQVDHRKSSGRRRRRVAAATAAVLAVGSVGWAATARATGSSVTTALVVSATSALDQSAAAGVAGQLDGVVLLTGPTSLSATTTTSLQSLQPTQVLVVGGTGVVSDAVLAAVNSTVPTATVTRVSGLDRFATAPH